MRVRLSGIAERLPTSIAGAVLPIARKIDEAVSGADERAVSRRQIGAAFMIRVGSALITYVSQVFLARWMGDFEYGIFVVVWVGAIIVGSLSCLGVQTAVMRFIPEYLTRNETGLLRGVLFTSRLHGIVAASIVAAAGLIGLHYFGDLVANYYVLPLYLAAVALPMLAIGEIQEGITRSFSWANMSLWLTFILRPILIVVFMALAIAFGAPANAVTAMAATIVATYTTSLAQMVTVEIRLQRTVPRGPRSYMPKLWIGVALPMFLLEGFFNLLTNVDILIVGRLVDPDKAAIYFASVKTLVLLQFVYFAVRVGGAQRFSQYHAAGDRERLESFVNDTLHWTFWPSLAMVGLLALIGKPLLLLFGPSFGEGYPLLLILSVGLLVRASIGPAEGLLPMAGQQRICAAVYTGAFLLNVVLNFTLIPIFGLKGAAMATSTALIAETIALYWVTVSRLGIRSFIVTARRPMRRVAETN